MFKLKKPFYNIIYLLIVFLSLLSLTPNTFAWLNDVYNPSFKKGIGNFDYSFNVYFEYEDESGTLVKLDVTNNEDYMNESNYYVINVSDEEAINYLANLRITIDVKGYVSSYVRVRIFDQLVKYKIIKDEEGNEIGRNGSILRDDFQPYICSSNWVDNRLYDNYIYYSQLIDMKNETIDEEHGYFTKSIPFINDVDITATNENGDLRYPKVSLGTVIYEIYFTLEVEGVQYNRYKQIWEIDEIPQG